MKKLRTYLVLALLLAMAIAPIAIARVSYTIDSVDDCYGGSICVTGTCSDGTQGTGVFTPFDTWGDVNAAFAAYCSP